jgi:hypothetical protein
MEDIVVKYRNWHNSQPPRPTKLQIPGWAGKDRRHGNGSEPQPWHCPPFVDASTYAHELVYPYKSECRVKRISGEVVFEMDFSNEDWMLAENRQTISGNQPKKKTPPMMSFAPGHYGMSSGLDLEPPEGYVIRTEPHPRFYTDDTGTVPCMLAGHIQRWWSRIFFVVFKSPREGEEHIFRHGDPYGQLLFVPQKNSVIFDPFTEEEARVREMRDKRLSDHSKKIANHSWNDNKMLAFDDKYKVLSSAYNKGGYENMDELVVSKIASPEPPIKTKIPKRLFFLKGEALQDKKKQEIKETPDT